jgi:hypothetical protein
MCDQCPVCLEDFNNHNIKYKEDIKKTLSCGHSLHFKCYRGLVYRGLNFFIECPLCRQINDNIEKPYKISEDNLRIFYSKESTTKRCACNNKNGKKCKNKASLFNYGMCYQHHKNILPKEKYPLMEKYIYLIMCQRNNWFSKIHLFDIGKKIIIHKNVENIEEIMFYFYKYINLNGLKSIQDYYRMYDYYELERPKLPWINYCFKNHIML